MGPDLNLARGTIDRDELTRNDARALASARSSSQARFILVAEDSVAIDPDRPGHLLLLDRQEATPWEARSAVYLGRAGENYYFACDATDLISSADVQPVDAPQMRPVRYWAHEWADTDTALAVTAVAAPLLATAADSAASLVSVSCCATERAWVLLSSSPRSSRISCCICCERLSRSPRAD